MNIALTGGIGSGKSCVAALLGNALGYRLVSADLIGRDLMEPGAQAWLAIRERWADTYHNQDGTINRALLRMAVFNDEQMRHALEDIMHPLIRFSVKQEMLTAEKAGEGLIIEIPLLFEVGWQENFVTTIAVYAPTSVCVQRICRRDDSDEAHALKILAAQMAPEVKARMAQFVIDNSGLWVQTVQQVARLARQLNQLSIKVETRVL